MVKGFLARLSPLVVMCFANVLLWLLLRGEFDSGDERGHVYEYFVMYVFYFTFFVAIFSVAASLAVPGSGGGVTSKAAYYVLSIPSALFSLVVGLLSLTVAFNGEFLAVFPAALYFIALILIARPNFILNKFFDVRVH